jgi:hypothetical protein
MSAIGIVFPKYRYRLNLNYTSNYAEHSLLGFIIAVHSWWQVGEVISILKTQYTYLTCYNGAVGVKHKSRYVSLSVWEYCQNPWHQSFFLILPFVCCVTHSLCLEEFFAVIHTVYTNIPLVLDLTAESSNCVGITSSNSLKKK